MLVELSVQDIKVLIGAMGIVSTRHELYDRLQSFIADTLREEAEKQDKWYEENGKNYIVHLVGGKSGLDCAKCGRPYTEIGNNVISNPDHWSDTKFLRCVDVTDADIERLAQLYLDKGLLRHGRGDLLFHVEYDAVWSWWVELQSRRLP